MYGARRAKAIYGRFSEEEFASITSAAETLGLTPSGYVAEVAAAVASDKDPTQLRELRALLVDLFDARVQAKKSGTLVNQAVAKLNATGQRSDDLLPAVEANKRTIERIDDLCQQIVKVLP